MNYYFFLKSNFENILSSIDLCNFSPTNLLKKDTNQTLYVYSFFTNGKVWNYILLDSIDRNHAKRLNYEKIYPIIKHEPFIFLSYKKINSLSEIFNYSDQFISLPAWRANIRLSSESSSCSYQGEYPHVLTNKASLVSCSPLFNKKSNNFFSLINIQKNPQIIKKKIDVLDLRKKKIGEFNVFTNKVNMIDLKDYVEFGEDNFYIFKSDEIGGVPVYLTFSKDLSRLSCEHTHPPVEYLLEGNRIYFQKLKKNYWLG